MTVVSLSRAEARRIAIRAQLLDVPRPTDLMDVARGLAAIQVDFTSAVAQSADLVLWSRIGSSYSPHHLVRALDRAEAVDLRGFIRPGEDIALYRAEMAAWPGDRDDYHAAQAEWVEVNDGFREDILERLEEEGPLTSRAFPDTSVVAWRSSGWNNSRNVAMMLDFLVQRGEVACAGRSGRDRLWDLASRVYPDTPAIPLADALRIRRERRLRALGIARARRPATPIEPDDVGDSIGVAAEVEGVKGVWRVDPEQLDRPFTGRTALLSPFDRLIFDRKRTNELFEYDYLLEMYKPAAKRKWGYYALPILHGDRLVGKLDATADRTTGVLRVDAVHEDVPFTKEMTAAVDTEIAELAAWLRLGLVRAR